MLDENILWARTISPTGKIVKEETALGALLAFIGIIAIGVILFLLVF